MVPYSKSATSISVVLNFTPKIIPSSHPNFKEIAAALEDPKTTEADLVKLVDIPAAIQDFTGGNVVVKNGKLYYRGFEVKGALPTLILQLVREGKQEAAKPFELFLEKAYSNPDPRARDDLYEWVVQSGLPITPDGEFLAWKAVTNNYRSIHSPNDPRFDHRIGKTVEMDRTECDANPDRTCSTGLHFAAADYLPNYASGGSRIVAVKINPADVVAFPRDYGWSKGRAAKYVIVGEVPLKDVPNYYPQGRRIYDGWEQKPVPTKPNAVGQVWRDRNGTEHTISSVTEQGAYPVRAKDGFSFTANGRFIGENDDHNLDLVKFVK